MNVLILGYGYCGYQLTRKLLEQNARVTTISRSLSWSKKYPTVIHRKGDLNTALGLNEQFDCIYYLAPPPREGKTDSQLARCLANNQFKTRQFVYFGSSAVYGDHKGEWVDESSNCQISFDTQTRRLDAESQLTVYAKFSGIALTLLRIGGIYGSNRLPLSDIVAKKPVLDPVDAPWSNLIAVKDLVNIVYELTGKVKGIESINIADGHPRKMGTIKHILARALNISLPPFVTKAEMLKESSHMMRMFLNSSKRLSTQKLNTILPDYSCISLEDGVLSALEEEGMGV